MLVHHGAQMLVHSFEAHTITLNWISAPAPVHQGAPTLFKDEKKLLHVKLLLVLLKLQKGL